MNTIEKIQAHFDVMDDNDSRTIARTWTEKVFAEGSEPILKRDSLMVQMERVPRPDSFLDEVFAVIRSMNHHDQGMSVDDYIYSLIELMLPDIEEELGYETSYVSFYSSEAELFLANESLSSAFAVCLKAFSLPDEAIDISDGLILKFFSLIPLSLSEILNLETLSPQVKSCVLASLSSKMDRAVS